MQITFLSAADNTPLRKILTKNGDTIDKEPYPHVRDFNSHDVDVTTLNDLASKLIEFSDQGACLLKGNTKYNLRNQSRAGSTDANEPTNWLVLDIDGLPVKNHQPKDLPKLIEQLIQSLPAEYHDVSYIVQYSASTGVNTQQLSAHLFFFLDQPIPPPLVKLIMRQTNLQTPMLEENMSLSRTNTVLRHPLDITANQNDKLLYIAAPKFVGMKDPLTRKTPRIFVVYKERSELRSAELLKDQMPLPALDKISTTKIDTLRSVKGLDKIRARTKLFKNVEIMSNPDVCTVTSVKVQDEFTYLNLNGGDSGAYYHPTNNADILYNFKGEPNYALKKILPEYYAQASTRAAKQRNTEQTPVSPTDEDAVGRTYLAFRDYRTNGYFNGSYDYDTSVLDLVGGVSRVMLMDYLKHHGQLVPDCIPDWNYIFVPDSLTVFDPDNKFINRFQASQYIADYHNTEDKTMEVPPTIHKVIYHALGSDQECYDRFMNWLAVIVQYRCKTMTAWLLHGTQGTGKGVLLNQIIAPILGRAYTDTKNMAAFEENFNGWIEQALCIMIDEVQVSKSKNSAALMQKIKNYITEPTINVRHMRQTGYSAISYLNLIFASNMPDPIQIDPTDRRFNCGVYQDTPIVLSKKEIALIEEELSEFTIYLMNHAASRTLAGTPLINQAHKELQFLTRNSIDITADALLQGNLEFFLDQMPTDNVMNSHDGTASLKYQSYLDVFKGLFPDGLNEVGEITTKVKRDAMRTLFQYCIGTVPESANKFTSFVKHHGIHVKKIRDGKDLFIGTTVKWNITEEVIRQWHQELGTKPVVATKAVRAKKVVAIKK